MVYLRLIAKMLELKSSPATRHWGALKEKRYSSYSFMTSALDGVVSVTPRPRFTPRERTPVPIVQNGWASEPMWTHRLEETFFRLCRGSKPDRPVVQPVGRYYSDWVTPASQKCWRNSSKQATVNFAFFHSSKSSRHGLLVWVQRAS
jgi:hypothetical protein